MRKTLKCTNHRGRTDVTDFLSCVFSPTSELNEIKKNKNRFIGGERELLIYNSSPMYSPRQLNNQKKNIKTKKHRGENESI